ncbi:YdcF family protein [Spirosoma endbachense]|uniref:YdcF family protein n=1 Tax=Spirosoma endbachense TaxID=2666025 RepID=A0A6P1VPK8_9BACT|nr:YdcF family protein [Spirosoma endbachense]QHV95191.1 YdcF family protein [Spirosoma endbachense]
MNKKLFIGLLCSTFHTLLAQSPNGFQPAYRLLSTENKVADKNYYLLTVIQRTPAVQKLLKRDTTLQTILRKRADLIKAHAQDTCRTPGSLMTGFRWSTNDSLQVITAMQTLYAQNNDIFDKLVNNHLRPSGTYQRFTNLPNKELLMRAWGQYILGINYSIDQFGLGKKMRYPRIDSANYPVNGRYYGTVLKDLFAYLAEQADTMTLFYQPSLAVAMQLMDVNDRDEPARHEPMEHRDNQKAYAQVKQTIWKNYRYAAIVVPGNGPELTTTPLSPLNKMRLDLVAGRYRKGWAPFIVVSGGYCYPFRGPYAEAVEMKKYLIKRHAIPEFAIIIDPHARHTTTNLRNANRLMIRYGFPADKICVFTTTQSQTEYANNTAFDERNRRELGYLPYRDKKRISLHDIEFYPTLESLHMDPNDPLDP